MTGFRRDLLTGAAAGLVGGLALTASLQVQGRNSMVAGLTGLATPGIAVVAQLLIAVLLGAGFGAIFRYHPESYATSVSGGLLYGLLWWIAGPLTLTSLLHGRGPNWSLAEATAAFPGLIAHLLYGGVMGVTFYVLTRAYARRYPAPPPASVGAPATRLLILGGGFGGVTAAQRLEQLLARDSTVQITLVSQSNYLLFTPMLAEVAASGLEARHISAPVRAALTRTQFRRAEVEAIDVVAQVVRVRPTPTSPVETLRYDHLILALGSVPNYHGLPGLEAHTFALKSLDDATRLRNHVIALLERADVEPNPVERACQLTFVVAGGGFAGTEVIAELFDLVHSVRRFYPRVQPADLRFVLVHSGARILPELSYALGAYAQQKLEARGIEFLLNTQVAGARPDAVMLVDGREILTRTIVWTAGNQPHPLLRTVPCERNEAGAVRAASSLQVTGLRNVWAVGDCARIPDVYSEGKPCPPTAQHAIRQGAVVAENVVAALQRRRPKPFRFRTIAVLVALGHRTAVAEVRGWKFSGLLAWFLWRTVYLSKLPGLEKKVRVALDWTLDLFFTRDIALTMTASTPTLSQTVGIAHAQSPAPAERPAQ
ncbi:MAG TPA: NAD(P)/FAD-dependent oxidoreductase [bacterium]|nr:NAD(P)/FAD-dependent oxidoreductase [bacterium]